MNSTAQWRHLIALTGTKTLRGADVRADRWVEVATVKAEVLHTKSAGTRLAVPYVYSHSLVPALDIAMVVLNQLSIKSESKRYLHQ